MVHLIHDAMAYVPKLTMRPQVAADIKAVFKAPDCPEAERQLTRLTLKHGPGFVIVHGGATWIDLPFVEARSELEVTLEAQPAR
jgi:hypothetical protein